VLALEELKDLTGEQKSKLAALLLRKVQEATVHDEL